MKRKKLLKVFKYVFLLIGATFILIPFIWMILTSLKDLSEIFSKDIVLFPESLKWENYMEVFKLNQFTRQLFNSVIVTICITLGELFTTILAAFAFSNFKFKGRDLLFTLLLGTMMIPSEILVIPNFVLLSKLGWIDTYKALIIPWCASVFAIFFLRQYFLGIPKELYYAAKVDGCSDFKYLCTVMVPIAKPAIVTLAILKIINSWNAFMWPLVVTNSEEMRTLPTTLAKFSSEVGIDYNLLMAATTIIILPMIIIYILLSKHIMNGVSRSGIKG